MLNYSDSGELFFVYVCRIGVRQGPHMLLICSTSHSQIVYFELVFQLLDLYKVVFIGL